MGIKTRIFPSGPEKHYSCRKNRAYNDKNLPFQLGAPKLRFRARDDSAALLGLVSECCLVRTKRIRDDLRNQIPHYPSTEDSQSSGICPEEGEGC